MERKMIFNYKYGELDYIIDNIDLMDITRNSGFINHFRNGKEKHSLIFTHSGGLEYRFEKRPMITALNETITYIPPQLPYSSKYISDVSKVKLLMFNIIKGSLPQCFTVPFSIKSKKITTIMNSIYDLNRLNNIFLAAKTYEILWIAENMNSSIPDKFLPVLPAVKNIEQYYFENKKISEYSDMCNMSESNFRKLFKAYTGKSPIEYRNSIRILEARKLITSSECTVEEAAYLTGFNNMSFFYEIYKKHFGNTHIKRIPDKN